ncbi:MAG: 3'-5' exonuclease [Candidatus Melainabacteria bacterium]|nr:3'-5' exonuclease [Candidatus Melainabacteria bacterium]
MSEKHIYIDLETTGLNANQDRICQIGVILDDGREISSLVNPEMNIPKQVSDLHGITNERVVDAPKFVDLAAQLVEELEAAQVFVAYNYAFDFQFLQNELFRTVQYELREDSFVFLDPYKIFKTMFPHNLSNAYKFYTGKELDGAHDAINDIRATKEILAAQQNQYAELFARGLKTVEQKTIGDTSILGKWFRTENSDVCFRQGKHRGETVAKVHRDYLKWIYSLEDISMSERRFISKFINA